MSDSFERPYSPLAAVDPTGEIFRLAQETFVASGDVEAVIVFLRDSGFSIVQSIFAVKQVADIGLGQAKEIVHHSAAWADVISEQEAFHEHLQQEAERLLEGGDDKGAQRGD